MTAPPRLCPPEILKAVTASARQDVAKGVMELDRLLADYPADARLLFLKGSLLAQGADYDGARAAMRKAVNIAPDYAIARFQLGLLELTCGNAAVAQQTWAPLYSLPTDNFLYLFATGLRHLIRDEFADTERCLRDGIARNRENPALNRDMQLVIDELQEMARKKKESDTTAVSSVGLLLQQASLKPRLH